MNKANTVFIPQKDSQALTLQCYRDPAVNERTRYICGFYIKLLC